MGSIRCGGIRVSPQTSTTNNDTLTYIFGSGVVKKILNNAYERVDVK